MRVAVTLMTLAMVAACSTAATAPPEGVVHRGPTSMPALHPSVDHYPEGRAILTLASGEHWDIPVLLALTDDHRQHGLMEVPDVPAATGMGFVFDTDRTCCFWMKGTLTDLDIAWIAADGTVVETTTMTTCRTDDCLRYQPSNGAAYRHALEVRAGWLAEIGLGEGDRIRLLDAAGQLVAGS
ncbi:MAG: DUF192 domain-containing protein [Nitriliruptorales bacterium]|nr:DUF192 domain-containing protein [Nitriliruptorales bacterium]